MLIKSRIFAHVSTGDITVVIETKLDLRDGAAWSQFDKAINRLEGGEGGVDLQDREEGGELRGGSDDDSSEPGRLSLCPRASASSLCRSSMQCVMSLICSSLPPSHPPPPVCKPMRIRNWIFCASD